MGFEDSLAAWEKTAGPDAIRKRHQSMRLTTTKVI